MLVRGERRFERQTRQAQDTVHRRPDFVAHVGEEFTLHAARLFRRATRLVELVRLILELPHQFPRQANGADQSRAQPLRCPRGQRDVEIRAVQQCNLEDLGRPGDVPVLEELELEQHRHIRGDRQVAERQRPPETRIRLIRRPDEEEEEQPASIAAGQINRKNKKNDVDGQEDRAQIDERSHLRESGVQHEPGHETVRHHDDRDPNGIRVTLRDEGFPQQNERGHEGEPDQAQARHFDGVKVLLSTTLLAVARLGVEVELSIGAQRPSSIP